MNIRRIKVVCLYLVLGVLPMWSMTGCSFSAKNQSASISQKDWTIHEREHEFIAHLKGNNSLQTSIEFPLDIDAPTQPYILDWQQPREYDGKIGLLHYYSGATGTHISAEITRYAIVNLDTRQLIGIIEASASQSGTRYHKGKNGKLIPETISRYRETKLHWYDNYLMYIKGKSKYRLSLFD